MNVVDSCGWLEYFADGQNADFFASAIEDQGSLIVPSIRLYEVFKRLATARAHGAVLWTQDVDLVGIEGVQYIQKK